MCLYACSSVVCIWKDLYWVALIYLHTYISGVGTFDGVSFSFMATIMLFFSFSCFCLPRVLLLLLIFIHLWYIFAFSVMSFLGHSSNRMVERCRWSPLSSPSRSCSWYSYCRYSYSYCCDRGEAFFPLLSWGASSLFLYTRDASTASLTPKSRDTPRCSEWIGITASPVQQIPSGGKRRSYWILSVHR